MIARAQAMLRRRVGYLMALDLFSDWPAQELGFLARWMTELRLRRMVRQPLVSYLCCQSCWC